MIAVDLVPERPERARVRAIETIDLREHDDDPAEVVREMTDGRGPDAVVDAVGMEAHGAPLGKPAQTMAGLLPDPDAAKLIETAGVDRLHGLYSAIDSCAAGAPSRSWAPTAAWPIRCP